MLRHFFAAPDFLALLRFWDSVRAAAGVAVWDGDFAIVPAALLPNLIVVTWVPVPVYRYIGSECAHRFGADTTGLPVLETLGGAYGRYISALGDEVIQRRAPIFSASVLAVGDELTVTGRLFAPFAAAPAAAPSVVMSMQLFSRSAFKLGAVGRSGFVSESQRLLVAGVPEFCARLDEARRYHHLSRFVSARAQASEWDDVAHELASGILVALTPFHDDEG
jgi:hypothetical protein